MKRWKQGLAAIVVLAELVFLLCGCRQSNPGSFSSEDQGGQAATSETARQQEMTVSDSAVTFTDALGRRVTVEKHPQRVAALIGSFAQVWQLAGGELVATANDAWTQFDLGLDETVVNLGTTTELSLEKLLASEPDFVIASVNTQIDLDWMDTLEAAKIPTAYFDVNAFEDYLQMLQVCTQITQRPDLYQQNGLAVQQEIEHSITRADGSSPTVLYLRATAVSVKAKSSRDNVLGEMLKDLGCQNIADSDTMLLEELSLERILAADPEYIFVVEQGTDGEKIRQNLNTLLLENPAWSSLTAVQQGRLYYLDQKLYNLKPNARWGEAYEKLADLLYPAQ